MSEPMDEFMKLVQMLNDEEGPALSAVMARRHPGFAASLATSQARCPCCSSDGPHDFLWA